MRYVLLCLLVMLLPGVTSADATTARRSMLVESSQLIHPETSKERFTDSITYIDVRSRDAYAAGHLPGARHLDAGEWKAAFGDGAEAAEWTTRIAKVLVDPDQTVIVYDATTTPSAARIWWILKYWGVDDVRLLDGGYRAWHAAGGEPSTRVPTVTQPADFTAAASAERLATFAQVQEAARQSDRGVCLVDVRTTQEHKAGKIPTARHLNWEELVDSDTGKLRPFGDIKTLLDRVGFDPRQPAFTYCGSGGRAAVMAFAMEYVGGKPAANYYGSYRDWNTKQPAGGGQPAAR